MLVHVNIDISARGKAGTQSLPDSVRSLVRNGDDGMVRPVVE